MSFSHRFLFYQVVEGLAFRGRAVAASSPQTPIALIPLLLVDDGLRGSSDCEVAGADVREVGPAMLR